MPEELHPHDPASTGIAVANVPTPQEGPGVFMSALMNDSPISSIYHGMKNSSANFQPDLEYVYDQTEQNRLFGDIQDRDTFNEAIHFVGQNAVSRPHAEALRDQFMKELEREQTIADAGGWGLATRIMANVVDPANIALTLATGGLGHLTKAGALRGALRVGGVAAAENAALEAAVAKHSGIRDSSDVFLSALGGFALGAGVGKAFGTPEALVAINRAAQRHVDGLMAETFEQAGLDSAGAARAAATTDPIVEAEILRNFNISEEAPKAAFGKGRFDAVGRGGIDEDPVIRDLHRGLAEEAVGLEGHGVVRYGASEYAALYHRTIASAFRRESEPFFDKWIAESGWGRWQAFRPDRRGEFFRAVGDQVRGIDSGSDTIRAAAKSTADALERYNKLANELGILGGVPVNRNYLPRIRSSAGLREMVTEFGESNVVRLIARAMQSNHEELADDLAQRYARMYVKKMRRLDAGMDTGIAHGLRTDDVDFLKSELRAEGVEDDLIDTIVAQTQAATQKTSRVTRAKNRLDFDETFEARLPDGRTMRVRDLFERDAEKLLFSYSRTMSGWLGLSRSLNVKNPGDWKRLTDSIRSRMVERGRKQEDIERTMKRLDFIHRGITGVPLEDDPASLFAKTARAARDFNFLRIGAAFGLAQLAEVGNVIGTAGFRATLTHVPALRGMIKRGVDGKLADDLAAEIEDMVGPGVDRLLNMPTTRWDEHGMAAAERGLGKQLDDAVQVAKRVTADIGGLSAATTVFQRMGVRALAQKITDLAHSGKVADWQVRRFRTMGWSEEMQKRIFKQIRKHSKTEQGSLTGRKLKRLNIDNWDDAEALDHLTMGLHREARRIVQENDIGASTQWLHSTTGKLMTQFRTFMLTSYAKSTLHNVHHHDLQAFNLLMTSMFMAGLGYIIQQTANVADKKKREERLSPENIALSAFQRTAMASIIPAMVDTVAPTIFRTDPVFKFGRSSGFASDFVKGVATVDLYDRLARVAGLPAVVARPDLDVTQRESRNIRALLPVLGGFVGMGRAIDAITEDLPE